MRGAGVALAALLLAGGAQARDRIDADDCSAAIKGANNTTTIVCGDQTITVGYTEEQFAARLKERTAELSVQVTALQAAVLAVPTLSEELTLKRAALAEAERQLADTATAFAESVALNEELRREIVALRAEGSGGVGAAKFEEALDALAKGERAAADALLAELQAYDPDMEAIARQARIAYERGRIAEAEIDYPGAMTQYMRAARLEPENYDYLYKARRYAQEAGKYDLSARIGEELLILAEAQFGPESNETAAALNELAISYQYQGNYAAAEPLYERSLAIVERSLGADHPSVATTLNNLAGLYRAQGNYAAAEPLYKRDLAISEKALGADHPEVAITLNNLAGLYRAQGNYAAAEPLYERSLAIHERSLGTDHPSVRITLNNLASLHEQQERYADAEPLYRRALAIVRAVFGDDHPNTRLVAANFRTMLAEVPETPARREEIEALEILQ